MATGLVNAYTELDRKRSGSEPPSAGPLSSAEGCAGAGLRRAGERQPDCSGGQSGGAQGKLKEEFQCAQFLDGLPEVKFWTRNLSGKATSFRLQTSTDWFYPDFVCQLVDWRTLVVENKGKDRFDNADSDEKRAVGAVWASRSGGRCLFAMPTDRDFSVIFNIVKRI